MHKVMLVDDEKLIIDGLMKIIDWNGLGFEISQTANNGEEAFEKFKTSPVDVIITDISMPKVNGLDLLEKVRALNDKIEFIVISAYDEFSYAQKAMKYGVENYILKPINEQELEDALRKMKSNLNNSFQNEKIIFKNNLLLFQYINGKVSNEYLFNVKNDFNISFYDKQYVVSIVTILGKYDENTVSFIGKIVQSMLKCKFELIHKYDGKIIVICSFDKYVSQDDVETYYGEIKNKIVDCLNVEVFISIGDLVESINELPFSFNTADDLRKYILTEGTNVCLSKNSLVLREKYKFTFNNEIEKINKLLIEKNVDKITEYINEILKDIRLTPENIYDLSVKILFLIDKVSGEFKLNKNCQRHSLTSMIVNLCNESTIENVKTFIISELVELIDLINNSIPKYSPVVQQVMNIVNEKYYEELSLKTLSQKYNVNSSYLGQIFNKEVGMSFSEYLNKVKNTKAKELILNTNMKINDIAKEVGYLDTSYFYRKFKKYFGICPLTMRNMKKY